MLRADAPPTLGGRQERTVSGLGRPAHSPHDPRGPHAPRPTWHGLVSRAAALPSHPGLPVWAPFVLKKGFLSGGSARFPGLRARC